LKFRKAVLLIFTLVNVVNLGFLLYDAIVYKTLNPLHLFVIASYAFYLINFINYSKRQK